MKKAIYTAIFGNYDTHIRPLYINDNYDYHLFTDNPQIKSNVYKIHLLQGDARKSREIKLLSHKYLPNYDYTIWHDGNMVQCRNIDELANLQQTNFMTMKHPYRNCIYDEANECINLNKDSSETIQAQVKFYKSQKFKSNMGLIASGLLFRKNTSQVQQLCESWHTQLQLYSLRDQISFNYILNQTIDLLPFSVLKTHFKYAGNHK